MRLNWRSFWTKLGLDQGTRGAYLDENVWNNKGMLGPHYVPVSISCFIFWTLSLHFWWTFSYQSNSPIICGFAPEAYAQLWLGLHSVDLTCLPSFENCKKAKDVLKEAIIRVQEVVLSPERVQVCLPPPPQNPHRSRKTPMHPCSLLPPWSVLHPNADMPSPLLCNACSPTLLPTRSRHLGTNPKVVIQAHRVCPDQVLGLSVVVGPARGPSQIWGQRRCKIGPLTISIGWQCQSPFWRGQWRWWWW